MNVHSIWSTARSIRRRLWLSLRVHAGQFPELTEITLSEICCLQLIEEMQSLEGHNDSAFQCIESLKRYQPTVAFDVKVLLWCPTRRRASDQGWCVLICLAPRCLRIKIPDIPLQTSYVARDGTASHLDRLDE